MSMEREQNYYHNGRKSGYLQALRDIEELLDNAIANGGGIDVGNGKFVERAHWDHELRDQLLELKGKIL